MSTDSAVPHDCLMRKTIAIALLFLGMLFQYSAVRGQSGDSNALAPLLSVDQRLAGPRWQSQELMKRPLLVSAWMSTRTSRTKAEAARHPFPVRRACGLIWALILVSVAGFSQQPLRPIERGPVDLKIFSQQLPIYDGR